MKTTIDWLTFRCRNDPFEVLEALRPAFGTAADLLTFLPGLPGKDGWLQAGEWMMGGDISMGRIDYAGGESQRGWNRVVLTGEGCAWVQNWLIIAKLADGLRETGVRRLDICLTTYGGEITHDKVAAAYTAGMFAMSEGGRPPVSRTITSSDPRAGKTIYVGQREYAKFFRAYEKGFEMLKNVAGRDRVTHIGGDKVDEIYRCEVEFKAVDKHIPWSAVLDRDSYFAGAYPFCALAIGYAHKGAKMATLPQFKPVATLDTALENCRVSYGAILRTALAALDGDHAALMQRVIGITHSDALVRAGVLTVEHPT